MPKSKVRKKDTPVATADQSASAKSNAKALEPSHPIYIAVMLGLMVIGLLWLVVNYIAGEMIPFMSELGPWNFAVGFAFMIVGLLMTMNWR